MRPCKHHIVVVVAVFVVVFVSIDAASIDVVVKAWFVSKSGGLIM